MLYELPFAPTPSAPIAPSFGAGTACVGGIAIQTDGGASTLPVLDATNVLILGVTGTGKTKSATVPLVKSLLQADLQKKAVFFETKTTFLRQFLTPQDKVIAYDASSMVRPCNLFQWNLIREVRQAQNPEAEINQIATMLFSGLLSSAENNRAWVESAKNTFAAVLRVIVFGSAENTTNAALVNALRGMSTQSLLAYLAKNPRNQSLLAKDFGYDASHPAQYKPSRRAGDILFFLNQVLALFGGAFESNGQDTIHDYLSGAYGRNLFLLHDLAQAESTRPFFTYFLKKLKDEKMSIASRFSGNRMLWCMDEIDKLGDGGAPAEFGLFQAATLGREYGLQVIVTTQSAQSLYGLAATEHIADAGLAGFPVIIAFRPGDPATLAKLQALFGSARKEVMTMPLSRYDHPTMRSELEPIVTDAAFAALQIGEAYAKLLSQPPQKVRFVLPHGS